jgi:hypothetical protein
MEMKTMKTMKTNNERKGHFFEFLYFALYVFIWDPMNPSKPTIWDPD